VVVTGVLVRRRVEADVVRDVAERAVQERGGITQRSPDRRERILLGVLQVQLVASRHDQHLVRRSAPVGTQDHDVVIRRDDPRAGGELGLDGGAQHAPAGEASERTLLVEHLTGDEREPEDLPVRVRERRAGLSAVVDDRLGVPDVRGAGVVGEPVAERTHELRGFAVVEAVQPAVVLRRVHEHLVDATRLGDDVDGAEVVHGEAGIALERREQVRHDANRPLTALVDGLERRQGLLLVPGAERARAGGVGLDVALARGEVGGPFRALRHDRHPPAGELVETHLTHSASMLEPSAPVRAEPRRVHRHGLAHRFVHRFPRRYTLTCRSASSSNAGSANDVHRCSSQNPARSAMASNSAGVA
jgi:hypothetical protein